MDEEDREAAERMASKGGKARAKKLSPERRREIAKRAAEARWSAEMPTAQYGSADRPLRIGEIEIPCYVLDDGRRVLVQRGMMSAMDMSQGTAGRGAGDRLSKFVATKALREFVPPELAEMITDPIKFRLGGATAYGYEATILADLCEAVLAARRAGQLNYQQVHIADQCEILVRGFARVGIVALVDEATGFQDARDRDALAKYLEKYVAKELRQWVRTFPRSFFAELCRLKGVPLPDDMRLPRYFGRIVNDLVYDRLAPGLRHELEQKNPTTGPEGRRKAKHHQWLTEDVGNPRLLHHLGLVEGIGKGFDAGEWAAFKSVINKRLPKPASTLPLFENFADADDED